MTLPMGFVSPTFAPEFGVYTVGIRIDVRPDHFHRRLISLLTIIKSDPIVIVVCLSRFHGGSF